MEPEVLAGLGWVVSPIVTRLLNEGFSYLGDNGCSCLAAGTMDRLDNLERNIVPQFHLVIKAAEKTEHKTEMERWLRTLKDALCEAEDVLDLYKYQLLEKKVNDLNFNPTAKFYSKFVGNIKKGLPINFSSQKIKLRRSLEKLEKIAVGADTFRKLLKMQNESSSATHDSNNGQQPNFIDSIPSLKVFGRDKERDEIIDKYLLDPSEVSGPEPEKCYSIVAIVGIGGVGKTTLAQQIYNDKKLEEKFDIKMWVCVSRKLDVLRCTREMIESASKQKCPPSPPPPPHVTCNGLKGDLIDLIKSKKILLILDDVWCENSNETEEWEDFIAPLAKAGKRGSMILMTTRTTNLPQVLHPQYSIMLQDLEEDAILSLFKHHAFYEVNLNNSDMQMELEDIGKKIVKKLHGSPLAAKVVGFQLRKNLQINYWRETLERDNLCDARGALLWSYQRLDAPLQRCFSYFSLCPKGTIYDSEEMIRIWIAEGFINSSNSRSMEDIGIGYFDELVAASFLQLVKEGYNTTYYNMHDLVHDLAENISKGDCFRIEKDEHVGQIPLTIRHLYVSDESLRENRKSIKKLKNLRTLIIYGTTGSRATDHIFAASSIKKCKKLRVLGIHGLSIVTLPESIGDLKHLRYLDLHRINVLVELPASLGKLYHLQLLHLPNDANLPRSLKNLINLRHFEKDYGSLTTVPHIGRLTSLQALKQFDVKKEKGYDIGQLKNLNEIRGRLTIYRLQNVGGNNRATEANLKNKRHLESLSLVWDNYDDDGERSLDLDLEVLEGLQPHPNLTNLAIEGYNSLGYPSWLVQEGYLQNLGSLLFNDCIWLEVLPDMRKLFPRCHKLEISNLPNLKKFPLLPESLKSLVISECPSLVFVSEKELQEGREDIFQGQEKIELILPSLLQEFKIRSCDITDRAISQLLRSLASLQCLKLEEINTISTLPSEEVLHHLISLTELQIIYCFGLKSLGGLYASSSLEILDIRGVPSLVFGILASGEGGGRGILPPSLRFLYIDDCTTMKSIDIAGDLPNLHTLQLSRIPSLASLSMSCLTALTTLRICECPLLSSLPSNLPDSIEYLCLDSCSGISSLPEHLPNSLEYLCLDSCSGISSLPEHLPKSLDMLNLKTCHGILSLPQLLPESLREIGLLDCPGITSLPKLPESLTIIRIFVCPILEKRCRSPDGEDWPKIAHIPHRYMYTETDLSEDIACFCFRCHLRRWEFSAWSFQLIQEFFKKHLRQ